MLPANERLCGLNAAIVIELRLVMQDEFVAMIRVERLPQVALKEQAHAGVGVEFGRVELRLCHAGVAGVACRHATGMGKC